jgi:hypothetical protein
VSTATAIDVDAPFGAAVYDHFEHAVGRLLERDRLAADPAGTSFLLRHLIEVEGVSSPSARDLLRTSGIRRRWNGTFAVDRAELLANWLKPHVARAGRVVDVLAGDCLLTGRLADAAGMELLAVERYDHYPAISAHPLVELVPYERLELDPEAVTADTVLLVAVLHHESRPTELRDLVLRTGARRFVVVENCVDSDNDSDFHLLMDLFYNRCLNDFGSECTREHRTTEQWRELLAGFGELVHFDELRAVPGLPFPYQLMVFER